MESGASARRRRLVERGSDRLAFITGQARSLPSDPSSPASPFSTVDAASHQLSEQQPSGSIGGEKFGDINQSQKSEPCDLVPDIQQTDEAHQEERKDKTLSNDRDLLQEFKSTSAVPEIQPVNETPMQRNDEDTLFQKTSHDGAASVQPSRREMGLRPRSVSPSQSNQEANAAWYVEILTELMNFSPHEITQSISASENNRLLSSAIIAFLVVLSNWGLDIGGAITRVVVGTRPLLFLILTNITIVYRLLMAGQWRAMANERGRPMASNLGSADSLGKMLEMGLLLQKAMGALMMDCSICAVILICFLGF